MAGREIISAVVIINIWKKNCNLMNEVFIITSKFGNLNNYDSKLNVSLRLTGINLLRFQHRQFITVISLPSISICNLYGQYRIILIF